MKRTIGITGASGQLGSLVIKELQRISPTSEIIAFARHPGKVKSKGVAVRFIDYDNPATIAPALNGIDRLLLISGNEVGKRSLQHKNVIAGAIDAGVKLLIYTSLLHADTSKLALAAEHRETEAYIQSCGIPFIILRNGWYIENYTANLGGVLASRRVNTASFSGKISAATRADYALAAATVLHSPDSYLGKTIELAGDRSFTMKEYAADISTICTVHIDFHNLSVDDYAQSLVKTGMAEPVADFFAAMEVYIAKDALYHQGHELSEMIGRPTTSVKEAIVQALGEIKKNK